MPWAWRCSRACSGSRSSAWCSRRCSTSSFRAWSSAAVGAPRSRSRSSIGPGRRSMPSLRAQSAVLAVLLAACASPGYRSSTVPVPAAFRETARDTVRDTLVPPPPMPVSDSAVPVVSEPERTVGSVDQASYWRALNDTTLDRLIGELLRSHLDVRSALARLRGARAARTETALDLVPTVTAAGGYTRQRLSNATFPIDGGGRFPDQDIWDAGFDASWELDFFGRVRHTVQAQGALVDAANADVRDAQVVLTAELARTYFELRGAQERLAVARRNGENQRRTFDVTQQRLDAGRGTAFDT